jgi:hypothetical protein
MLAADALHARSRLPQAPPDARRPLYDSDVGYPYEPAFYLDLCRGVAPSLPPLCPPAPEELELAAAATDAIARRGRPLTPCEVHYAVNQITRSLPRATPR